MKKQLILTLFLFLPMMASAQEVEIDGLWYNLFPENNTAEVIKNKNGIKYKGDIVIPNKVISNGVNYVVNKIHRTTFHNCDEMTSISIPYSVTTIEVGSGMFINCSSLSSIIVEKENPVYDSRSNCNAIIETSTNTLIAGCKGTIIPNGVIKVGDYSFSQCTNLISLSIPNSVTTIGEYAFESCTGLASVSIPSNVVNIEGGAFGGCTSLTNIAISSSVRSIGEKPFSGCYSLSSIHVEKDNPVYDSRSDCNAIIETSTNTLIAGCKNTIIPNGVTCIGDYAFYNCSGLTSLSLPNSVNRIGAYAFHYCIGLTSVFIPRNITTIGHHAFEYCTNLNSVNISDFEAWCNISFENKEANPLYCAHRLFLNGEELTDIVIPSNLTTIGYGLFAGWSFLKSVVLPNSITSIEKDAFRECSGLTSINIPYGVLDIGDYAFDGCSGLTSVSIPSSVTSIGSGAFSYCSSLNSIIIPNSVKTIGESGFHKCSGLTSILLSSSLEKIERYTFYKCTNLTSILIPNSVTSIEDRAFRDCSSLKSITISNAVRDIGSHAFYGCSSLASITIPDLVNSIGEYAFVDCICLDSLTIGANVSAIGKGAFTRCDNLVSIVARMKEPFYIASNQFPDVVFNNAKLSVPKGTKELYQTTDYWSKFRLIEELSDEETGIGKMEMHDVASSYYYLPNGQRSITPSKGINIVRMQDGSTRKIIFK